MYINESISLDKEPIPVLLQNHFKTLKEFYDKKDECGFDNYLEGVESAIKGFCICGKISEAFGYEMFRKYGIPY